MGENTTKLRIEIEAATFRRQLEQAKQSVKELGGTAKDVDRLRKKFNDLLGATSRATSNLGESEKQQRKSIRTVRENTRALRGYERELQKVANAEKKLADDRRRTESTRRKAVIGSKTVGLQATVQAGLAGSTEEELERGLAKAKRATAAVTRARNDAAKAEITDAKTRKAVLDRIAAEAALSRLQIERQFGRKLQELKRQQNREEIAEARIQRERSEAAIGAGRAGLRSAVQTAFGGTTPEQIQAGQAAAIQASERLTAIRKDVARRQITDQQTLQSTLSRIDAEGELERQKIAKASSSRIDVIRKQQVARLAEDQLKLIASTRLAMATNRELSASHIQVVESVRKRLIEGEKLNREERAIISIIKRKIAHNTQLTESEKRLADAIRLTSTSINTQRSLLIRLGNSVNEVQKSLARARNALLVYGFGVQLILQPMLQAVRNAAALEKGMAALDVAARRSGVGMTFAREQAIRLSKDGLLNIGEASLALARLLQTGIGMEKSVQLMNAFKDAAVFAGQGTRTLNENITVAIDGFRNFQSRSLDNIGITKNADTILRQYARSVGKSTQELTELEKHVALANGLIKESAFQSGSAALASRTLTGSVERLTNSWQLLSAAMGQSIASRDFINGLADAFFSLSESIRKFNQTDVERILEFMESFGLGSQRDKQILDAAKKFQDVIDLLQVEPIGIFDILTTSTGSFIQNVTQLSQQGAQLVEIQRDEIALIERINQANIASAGSIEVVEAALKDEIALHKKKLELLQAELRQEAFSAFENAKTTKERAEATNVNAGALAAIEQALNKAEAAEARLRGAVVRTTETIAESTEAIRARHRALLDSFKTKEDVQLFSAESTFDQLVQSAKDNAVSNAQQATDVVLKSRDRLVVASAAVIDAINNTAAVEASIAAKELEDNERALSSRLAAIENERLLAIGRLEKKRQDADERIRKDLGDRLRKQSEEEQRILDKKIKDINAAKEKIREAQADIQIEATEDIGTKRLQAAQNKARQDFIKLLDEAMIIGQERQEIYAAFVKSQGDILAKADEDHAFKAAQASKKIWQDTFNEIARFADLTGGQIASSMFQASAAVIGTIIRLEELQRQQKANQISSGAATLGGIGAVIGAGIAIASAFGVGRDSKRERRRRRSLEVGGTITRGPQVVNINPTIIAQADNGIIAFAEDGLQAVRQNIIDMVAQSVDRGEIDLAR
jgi:hypothetical protein